MIIHNHLLNNKGVVVPQYKRESKGNSISGGYVKDPQIGRHNWTVSFDLTSLYPHLIIGFNISPETYRGSYEIPTSKENYIDLILSGYMDNIRPELLKNNFTMSGLGCFFTRDFRGFLPELMKKLFEERKIYKKKMLDAKKAIEKAKAEGKSKEAIYELEKLAAKYKNLQQARKINLNGAYGALSNPYFRWFDDILAESVTMSGQLSIRWIEKKINQKLNKILKTEEVDYVVASDTDSIYIRLEDIVKKTCSSDMSKKDIVKYINKVCDSVLTPFIESEYKALAEYMNMAEEALFMKREAIGDSAIWTAKKRYVMNVYDNEGVIYENPELKMVGIEAIRSSTPQVCRENIKKAISIIMNEDEKTLIKFVEDYKNEFCRLPFDAIAFPRSVNGIVEYGSKEGVYKKGTPIHTRAALVYNHILKERKLDKKLPSINEGDKIKFCYMKLPNPFRENIFACPDGMPPELGFEKFIDYETQYQKAFIDPLMGILEAIGWSVEEKADLSSFFS